MAILDGHELRGQGADLVGRFTNYFHVAGDSVAGPFIPLEILEMIDALKISGDPVDRFDDVFQVILDPFRVLHSGCASRNTRSRNFTDKNPGVSTDTGTPSNSRA
jgi:hypothetical protein